MDLKELKDFLLKGGKNIVITSHKNPDGDAIGSSLGLHFFLRKFNNNVSIILPTRIPYFLEWMPESKNILIYENSKLEADKKIEKTDIIFCLDYNDLSRIGEMEEVIKSSKAKKIVIDHHKNPDILNDYIYSDISMCATSQMIYHFMEKLGEIDMLDKYISTCLYTGIMTDTGSFRFRTVTATTHKVISHFIDKSIDIEEIHSNVHDVNTIDRYKILSIFLNNMEVYGNVSYSFLSSEDFSKINFNTGITEGFVNYGLSLKNIELTAIFIEKKEEGLIKISLRSKGNIDVNEIAKNHFNGGGHKNASGGVSYKSLNETITIFKKIIKNI